MQHCDWCGEELGVYAYSRTLDGPRSCGKRECDRYGRDEERAEAEERERQRQEYWHSRGRL